MRAIREFDRGARGEIRSNARPDYLFPTRRGDRMTRQAFWHIIKRYARKAGSRRSCRRTPCAMPSRTHLLNHGADLRVGDVARTQRPVHHADLHPRRGDA